MTSLHEQNGTIVTGRIRLLYWPFSRMVKHFNLAVLSLPVILFCIKQAGEEETCLLISVMIW